MKFSNPQKSTKMLESSDPGVPKVSFYTKNNNFGHPFLHGFFNVFRKLQKCEKYNAKRGSELSKSFDFRIVFSLNFHVFSNTLPETIFGRSRRRSKLKNAIF